MSVYYYYCKYCDDYKKKDHKCSKGHDKYDKCCEEKKQIIVKVDCCCEKEPDPKPDPTIRPSGFRAEATSFTPVVPNASEKVSYAVEIFDYYNEYDPETSTFTPKTAGLYIFTVSVSFLPASQDVPLNIGVGIWVNDEVFTREFDDEYFARTTAPALNDIVENTVILQLKAGDRVYAKFNSNQSGIIDGHVNTAFSGARFPSPA